MLEHFVKLLIISVLANFYQLIICNKKYFAFIWDESHLLTILTKKLPDYCNRKCHFFFNFHPICLNFGTAQVVHGRSPHNLTTSPLGLLLRNLVELDLIDVLVAVPYCPVGVQSVGTIIEHLVDTRLHISVGYCCPV